MHPCLRTRFCDLVGVQLPIVQTGMGWVAGPRLVTAVAEAGGLGILASATMTVDELRHAVGEVKRATARPFGVNLRADAVDAPERVQFLVEQRVAVASFAQAPKPEMIAQLRDAGIVVVASVGARRHAEKVLDWGVDAVLAQGAEGGGHTGAVPTSLLVPQVVDAVAGRIPVIAAGGYFDGRGLVAALAYGADAVAMGTRFLLTADSGVPDAVKAYYLSRTVLDTVVTARVDGVPHRVLRTPLVERLESGGGRLLAHPRALANAARFRRLSGMTARDMWREGRSMRRSGSLSWAQVALAANTPMLLRSALVEGRVEAGVMASGQVVGVIDDLPTVAELVARTVAEAEGVLSRLATPDTRA